jgi:hypothetical protein
MNTAAHWLRGGIAALTLVAPSTGQPAVNNAVSALSAGAFTNEVDSLASAPRVERPAVSDDPFPGRTYGDLDDEACLQALDERHVDYERPRRARGVSAPVHLMGALHGVRFVHAELTEDWEESARREVLDCRLVLSLDDLAALLAKRGVTTVFHYGVYRGDLPLPKHGRPLHHVAALAIDIAGFERDDGTKLDVRHDWAGWVGAPTCSEKTPIASKKPNAGELHDLLCDVAGAKLFHQVLTPNHDAKHRDHFHLEVMRQTSWTMLE